MAINVSEAKISVRNVDGVLIADCPVCPATAKVSITRALHLNIYCRHCQAHLISRSNDSDQHIISGLNKDAEHILVALVEEKQKSLEVKAQ
jgi:hypothetical protein